MIEQAIAYARQNAPAFLEDLKAVVRIPSISTLPENRADMQRTAEWLADHLRRLGFDRVSILPTAKHPVVFGEWLKAGKDKPTLLYYGHYDVQPPDPLALWKTPPFEPTIVGENLFARGASDMKGQLVAFLKALESLAHSGGYPVNLKVMLEGEEEVGSPSLRGFMEQHKEMLACTYCLNGDGGIQAPDVPSITYTLRGLSYFEIRVHGPAGDLHSGEFGGAVENPANVLCRVIAGMQDAQGRVTLPGFYDQVRPISKQELAEARKVIRSDAWWLSHTGAPALGGGEVGYGPTDRATARPTLDVNGLLSGFTGEGSKTVLPSMAMAKFSMRLVPDQDPAFILRSLGRYLEKHMPPSVTWELLEHASSRPAIVERDSAAARSATRALEQVWGKKPIFTRQGGSIPVVGLVQEILGVDSLLLGFGLPDDNLHAPNEKLHLPNFRRGVEAFIRYLYLAAAHG
jgi:acetylornithine deacetylase/succinyl-diaminopimelate desuccinylase-like protein